MIAASLLSVLLSPLALFAVQEQPELRSFTVLARGRVTALDAVLVQKEHLWVSASDLRKIDGFVLKLEGICAEEICVPIPSGSPWTRQVGDKVYVDASALPQP